VAVALFCTAAAILAAMVIAPEFNDAPVPIFLAAVLVSAWLCGFWTGSATTILLTVALTKMFDLSRASPLPRAEDTAFDVTLFVAVALLINWLTTRLRSTIRNLEEAQVALENADRARDVFVGAAAHDLKSPLSAISAAAQLATSRLVRGGSDASTLDAVRVGLGDIESETSRMSTLLDELLDLTQLQAGKGVQLQLTPTRLFNVVEQVVAKYRANAPCHPLSLEATADPIGMWDANRLRRVVDNLLSNAVKYSPPGSGIEVTVSEERGVAGQRVAWLRVRDHGIGIAAAEMEQLFAPFFRGRNVADISGTGLGLAGAQAIIKQLGGSIQAESQEGVGSIFSLNLPAQSPEGSGPDSRGT